MSIFNEYLTGIDRELAIEESAFDVEFSKLQTMYEMVKLQYDQMCKDAELKVLTESGTYDDLTFLISEAEAEVGEQKKGIIARFIEAIGKLFSAIGKKISEIFGLGDANMDVEVPADTVEKGNALLNSINNAQNGIAKLRNGDFTGALDLLKALAIPVIATGATVGGVVLYKKGKLDELIKKIQAGFQKLKEGFEDAKNKILGTNDQSQQDAQNNSLNIIQKIGTAINKFVSLVTSCITKAITKVGDKIKGNKNNTEEGQTGTDGTDGGEQQPTEEQNNNKITVDFSTTYKSKAYRLLSNGKWQKKDPQTKKWMDVPTPPPALVELAKNNVTKESSIEDIQDILGSNFIIEKSNDTFIITEKDSDFMESTSRSIFGYDLSNEEVFEESTDAFDKELEELSEIFEGL